MAAPASSSDPLRGAGAAALCYFLWGLVPLYWTRLAAVDPVELIAHRHVWSLALLLGLLVFQGGAAEIRPTLRDPRSVGLNLLNAAFLTGNWLVYVWGVNTGHVIECSLGYFLVPLVNVAAGRWILREHLRRAQWIAIALAAAGVVLMFVQLDRPPWIALALAGTWGAYSLSRKRSKLGAVAGLAVESLLLAPVAAGFLAWQFARGHGVLGQAAPGVQLLVLCSGIVTAVPLLLFAYGAKRIRLSTLGLLQYLAPTVQFMLGIWVYREPFPLSRGLGFAFIWAALALYTADNLLAARPKPAAQ